MSTPRFRPQHVHQCSCVFHEFRNFILTQDCPWNWKSFLNEAYQIINLTKQLDNESKILFFLISPFWINFHQINPVLSFMFWTKVVLRSKDEIKHLVFSLDTCDCIHSVTQIGLFQSWNVSNLKILKSGSMEFHFYFLVKLSKKYIFPRKGIRASS